MINLFLNLAKMLYKCLHTMHACIMWEQEVAIYISTLTHLKSINFLNYVFLWHTFTECWFTYFKLSFKRRKHQCIFQHFAPKSRSTRWSKKCLSDEGRSTVFRNIIVCFLFFRPPDIWENDIPFKSKNF